MTEQPTPSDPSDSQRGPNLARQARTARRRLGLYLFLAFSLLWLGPALACGSFAPRPTPTPTMPPVTQPTPVSQAAGGGVATPTPSLLVPTPTPLAQPTATFTPTPLPGTAIVVGGPVRIAAPGGLNLRETASTSGPIITRLGFGQVVTVVDGPVTADGFTWWKVDDGQGNTGWVAEGDGEDEWLTPRIGEAQPVNRAPRVGDRVRVTMDPGQQLSVRALPGTDAPLITRVDAGDEFTVVAGPQSADGFIWYQIRSDDGSVEGWAADGDGETRWLSPLE